ncbi:MAG: response regulator [Phycisphaerae bacterium]|nr:response regulator [Phycisphaerae bacterium]
MATAVSQASHSALVVDDDAEICELIRQVLTERGMQVQAVADAEAALDSLAERDVDVVVTDIALPHVGGLELLDRIRRTLPDCPVVLITGLHQRDYIAQALILGAFDYIEKPFSADKLAETVEAAIAASRPTTRLSLRAAEALELREGCRRAALQSVRALARAVEAKDPFTRRHSDHVAHYATTLAREMGIDERTIESIRVAALLHDVGKIGVPDHILTKPAPLSGEEFGYIRRHPNLGAEILASVTIFGPEAELVRRHHERWDGRGYPDGWGGERTPLGARVIGVADTMDAILMPRTYKPGMSPEYLRDELDTAAGHQLDPCLARLAAQWARNHPDELILPGAAEPDAEPVGAPSRKAI